MSAIDSEFYRGYFSYFKFIEDDDNLCSPITPEEFEEIIEIGVLEYKSFPYSLLKIYLNSSPFLLNMVVLINNVL